MPKCALPKGHLCIPCCFYGLFVASKPNDKTTTMIANMELHCHYCCLEFSKGAKIVFKSHFAGHNYALWKTREYLFSSACSVVLCFSEGMTCVSKSTFFECHVCLCVCILQQCCGMVHGFINAHKTFKEVNLTV